MLYLKYFNNYRVYMHHRKTGRKLNRNSSHRKLMFANLMNSLIRYGIIKTTLSKAKELSRLIEPIITKSKIDNLSNRRYVFNLLRDKRIVNIVFWKTNIFFMNMSGGYTRIIKAGFRKGDNAPLAYVKLSITKE